MNTNSPQTEIHTPVTAATDIDMPYNISTRKSLNIGISTPVITLFALGGVEWYYNLP